MKRELPSNETLDSLTKLLIKASQNEDISQFPAPFFMNKLRARIQEEKRAGENRWASSILATSRWLLALSTIALLFFGVSLWALTIPNPSEVKYKKGVALVSDENAVVDNLLDEPIAFAEDRR